MRNSSKIDIEANPFFALNIFKPQNRSLLFCFLFFFTVAVCGYLSVIILSVPYRDDWYRYLLNSHVGGFEALRNGTALIEYLFYLSDTVTDASPFTQVLSCATLAYIACIFLLTFKVNLKNKWEILCFTPIVINPYLLEVMLYRFDNFFIILSLLIVSLSVYLSNMNKKDHFITQSLLLFLSLFVYQVAISIYFTVFIYQFIKNIRSNVGFVETARKMKYWLYSLISVCIGYMPFLRFLDYHKTESGEVLALPYNSENISVILHNIYSYFQTFYNDWSLNVIGLIMAIMFFVFILNTVIKTIQTTKSIYATLFILLLLFIFLISPSGLYIGLKAFKEQKLLSPRLLCGIGVFIAIVNYEVYLLFCNTKITKILTKIILCLITTWTLMFFNTATNILRENFKIRDLIEYDITKDIFEVSNQYPQITHFSIIGKFKTPSCKTFFELYPIMNRIFSDELNIFTYHRLGFINDKLEESLTRDETIFFYEPKHFSKKLIKRHMMYDLYILNDYILQIALKKAENPIKERYTIMKIFKKSENNKKLK